MVEPNQIKVEFVLFEELLGHLTDNKVYMLNLQSMSNPIIGIPELPMAN